MPKYAALGLYARTVAHLRPAQIAHSLYRIAFPRSRAHVARDAPYVRRRAALARCLHSNRGFDKAVFAGDWACPELPRLWRYHLHYFDFLNDGARADNWKDATVTDWIDANPANTPDAWDPYPVSLRIVNWVKFFDRNAGVEAASLASLYAQTLWLENNLERRVLANHYLKNAKALVFAGIFFEGADADRWRKTGLAIFLAELREQFLADGGHYERSPMYHLIGLEDILDVINITSSAPEVCAPETLETLRTTAHKALDFLDTILMPDGAIPLFNDAAFGVGPEPDELFAYAGALLDYTRPAQAAGPLVRALPQSGYYVIRDGTDMLVIDCGVPGPDYQPGHAHADVLSFELALDGKRVVVDTGVKDYEASETRRYARSTAAHNTLTVDGHDQSELWGVFRMGRRARPIAPQLTHTDGEARFIGGHDGYRRFGHGVVHRRSVRQRARAFNFEDTVSGRGEHLIESRIHFAPHLNVRAHANVVHVETAGRTVATISVGENATLAVSDAPRFPRFGEMETCKVITMTYAGKLPVTLTYTIEGAAGT